MSTVCVVGLGYIGLPVASMLASRNHEVIGCDINEKSVESINNGRAHFYEPDLDMLLTGAITSGRFRAQSNPIEADYYVIAVPTPFRDGHQPDLSYVEAAAASIAPFLRKGSTIIIESTIPVGTTEKVTSQLASLRADLKFPVYKETFQEMDVHVAHCPERILPGQMMRELVTNDRIIGGLTENCARKSAELYESFVSANCYVTDCRTAELVKLVENSYRDVNIAFANELSIICDRLGVDIWSAIDLANKHPRVNILQPGAGVGGHCIAVDPWFIVDSAPEESQIIRKAREINDHKPHWLLRQILAHADRLKQPVIACFGLAYKPDVEDMRESPSLEIVLQLAKIPHLQVLVCEPMIKALPLELKNKSNVRLVSMDEARKNADIAVFLVGHRHFRSIKPSQFLNKIVIDAIGLLSKPSIQI